jgi:GTPase SAR1 family protein
MAIINLKKGEVQAKIVYYGPGRGGKTTNLEYIYGKFQDKIKTEMVTIKTHGDRTLFFDFLLSRGGMETIRASRRIPTRPACWTGTVLFQNTPASPWSTARTMPVKPARCR